jgi:hypothetical protein
MLVCFGLIESKEQILPSEVFYMNVFGVGASLWERVATFLLLPLLRPAIYKNVGCGKENAKEISFRKIRDIFSKVKAYNLIPSN